mmetsp:Transcript_37721/g.93381  ORF Transcript_37721/g.93381 Transcript_37721/m.93381 type:complete len:402 (+) Transcript_37721:74-1279(+)
MSMSRGVNGYTGFVPQSEVIPIAIKDTNERTGRVRSSTSLRGTGGLVIENAPTEMQAAFTMTPDMFPRDMSARASGALSPYNPFHDGKTSVSKPFVAESTYRQEMLAGAMKTAHVLTSGTYVGGTCRPDALGLKNPLYVSEQSQKQAEAFGIASVVPPYVPVGGYEAPSPVPTLRERQRLERDFKSIEQAASRANLDTSYRQAYGGKDFVPRSTIPMRTRDLSLKASTRELFLGTPKSVDHVPGYCGFIAHASRNRRAMAHSGMTDKASTKTTLLSELGQYPRNLPGYLGFQPSAFANQIERNRPLGLTTSGRADMAGSQGFLPGELGTSMHSKATVQYTPSQYGVGNAVVSNFFTHAAATISDNGVHNAEAYYKLLRPREGRSTAIIKAVSQAPILSNMV